MSTANPERSKVLWLGAPPHLEHDIKLANRGLTICAVDAPALEKAPFVYRFVSGLVTCSTPLRVRTIQGPECPYEEAS
jgi:hypothetical protein